MTIALAVAALLLVHWLTLCLRIRLGAPPLPSLPADRPDDAAPRVSVIVAVRNETRRILERSLLSMIEQDYPALEVVAIDDHSDDGSDAVLQRLAEGHALLVFLRAEAEQHGKRASVARAAASSLGDWLLFTDADAVLEPTAVRRAVGFATRERIDALSLLPRSCAVGFWEQTALAAAGWLAFEGPALARCNLDSAPVGLAAAGPFLMVRRAAYERIGGYDAIEQDVLTDVALARRIRAAGFRYRYLRSDGAVSTRMYRSLAELWCGFAKNAYLAVGARPLRALASALALLSVTWLPVALGAYSLSLWSACRLCASVGVALGGVSFVLMLDSQRQAGRFMGERLRFGPLAFSMLGSALWVAILAASAWSVHHRGEVRWSGRRLPIRPAERRHVEATTARAEPG